MPNLYSALSMWFSESRLRMGVLVVAVLGTLVGFGIYRDRVEADVSARLGGATGLVWAVVLAVVWFDERKRPSEPAMAWILAVFRDLFFVIFTVVLVLGRWR